MVLVDTSVWVAHLRDGHPGLVQLLFGGKVMCHPLIIGELACGHIENREEILMLLNSLPSAIKAGHEEVLHFIETHHLMGIGLGYIDVHLLVSAMLSGISMWTDDNPLKKAARNLGISFK